jgi:tetratricopeptide (TPR) repeat protein
LIVNELIINILQFNNPAFDRSAQMQNNKMEEKADQYLLQNTPEALQMVQNLQNLLESNKTANLELAFQLMESGGLPPQLFSHLLAIKLWHRIRLIRHKAHKLVLKLASEPLLKYLKNNSLVYEHQESKITLQFRQLNQYAEVRPATLAWMSLKLRKKGGKFCLEEQTNSAEAVLRELSNGTELYLANFELKNLPPEIGLLSDLTVLNISGNAFSQVPAEIAQLTKLETLYYARTPLSSQTIKQLEAYFPKLFASKYFHQATDLQSDEKYPAAIKLFLQVIKLDEDFAEAWHQLAKCYLFDNQLIKFNKTLKKAITLYETRLQSQAQIAANWYSKACAHALLRNDQQALEDLAQAISLDFGYKTVARHEEDLIKLINEPKFKALIS